MTEPFTAQTSPRSVHSASPSKCWAPLRRNRNTKASFLSRARTPACTPVTALRVVVPRASKKSKGSLSLQMGSSGARGALIQTAPPARFTERWFPVASSTTDGARVAGQPASSASSKANRNAANNPRAAPRGAWRSQDRLTSAAVRATHQ